MENPSGHSEKCAISTHPKSECRCRCNKTLHGILAEPGPGDIPRERVAPNRKGRPRKKKARRATAIAAVVTVAGTVGGLTATGTFGSSSSGTGRLSAQVDIDLNDAISALSRLGFSGKLVSRSDGSGTSQTAGCAESATGHVRQFLINYPCEQYASDIWSVTRQYSTTSVAFTWVEMPTTPLASRYKVVVDTYSTGNPPGVSSAFNGLCYASGQQGSIVWTVEVQPTGNPNVDRTILQAATPQVLPSAYLTEHCVT
jgi:hypothetical protein